MKFEVGDVVVPSENFNAGTIPEGFKYTELLVEEIGVINFTGRVLIPSKWHGVGYKSNKWTIDRWTVKEDNKTFEDCM
jgi:hypothetical protein